MNKKIALVLILTITFGFSYLYIDNSIDKQENLVIGEDIKFPDEFDNYIILNFGVQEYNKNLKVSWKTAHLCI